MYLLDTNVVSEFRKIASGKSDPNVARWASGVDPETLFLSVITIHELEFGELMLRRRDPSQAALLRRWIDEDVHSAFRGRVLPVDEAVARRSAALHVPNPCDYRDGFIAATAAVHGLKVVTRNVVDFERTGVDIIDPWMPAL